MCPIWYNSLLVHVAYPQILGTNGLVVLLLLLFKILRSDNTLEYVQHVLLDYCVSHDIIHQTSCVYTPQQNDVVERKNRHLLLTLLKN